MPPVPCNTFLLIGQQINYLMGVADTVDENGYKKYLKVGRRSMHGAGDAYLDLDKLLGRHVAVMGNDG